MAIAGMGDSSRIDGASVTAASTALEYESHQNLRYQSHDLPMQSRGSLENTWGEKHIECQSILSLCTSLQNSGCFSEN
jgi:hypothetical protein